MSSQRKGAGGAGVLSVATLSWFHRQSMSGFDSRAHDNQNTQTRHCRTPYCIIGRLPNGAGIGDYAVRASILFSTQ
jgi:hypothetical protein